MSWEVEYTDQFEDWWSDLTVGQQEALAQRVERLTEVGPSLKRPIVGEVKGSKFDPQMKEIICETEGSHLRVLFMFDPRRCAILLIGGDKTGEWKRFYKDTIPVADKLYEDHLDELEKEEAKDSG